jgi:hypothetical protein
MPGKSAAGSPDVMEEWAQVLEGFLQWYSSQNIYNADETGLYYNLLNERTLRVKDNICKGGKRRKDSWHTLLCTQIGIVPIK